MSFGPLKILFREWRSGELHILSLALFLSVSVSTAISAFTQRLDSALTYESHRFLAADLVIRSNSTLPEEWLNKAVEKDIEIASTMSFPSMLYAPTQDLMRLASIKAVSYSYPLRGELIISEAPFTAGKPVKHGPLAGEVWLESRLFSFLGVDVGDSVLLGDAELSITGVIRSEPDRGDAFSGVGPRVLLNIDDIPKTNIIQPGSRVEYRQLFAADQITIETFAKLLAAQIKPGQTILGLGDSQPNIARAMERVEVFLLLSGSLTIILAGAAISSSARRFAQRHVDSVAVIKSLGLRARGISFLYAQSFGVLALLVAFPGCVFGFFLQTLAFSIIGERLPVDPGAAGISPYLMGLATSFTCLFIFAWPSIRRLSLASPMRVLTSSVPEEPKNFISDYLIGLISLAALIFIYSHSWKIVLSLLGGLFLIACAGLFASMAFLTGSRAVGMRAGSVYRIALAGLQRRGVANGLQVVIFAMAIMALMVLLGIRTSLLNQWESQLPRDTPNHFLLNIAPDEVAELEQFLESLSVRDIPLFPLIRGRIISINDRELPSKDSSGNGRRQREANFTWSEDLPLSNTIVAGSWWKKDQNEALVSIEREYATRMDLEVGDLVGFDVGGHPFEAVVGSIREVNWQSFRPNFFMIFPQKTLSQFPSTFMTSFHLTQTQKPILNQLVRHFPTITIIEMDVVLEQIREVIGEVSAAVELVLIIVLGAGILVLMAGVQATMDSRIFEGAILRVFGAPKRLILGGLFIEFAMLGLIAGLLACFGAELSIYAILTWLMETPYSPVPWIWLVGVLGAISLISCVGVLASFRVVNSSPLLPLRE